MPHARQRLLLQLRHLADENGAVEVPPGCLEQMIERPAPLGQHRANGVVGLAGVVEAFGDDDLPAVQFTHIAERVARLRLPRGS